MKHTIKTLKMVIAALAVVVCVLSTTPSSSFACTSGRCGSHYSVGRHYGHRVQSYRSYGRHYRFNRRSHRSYGRRYTRSYAFRGHSCRSNRCYR